MVKPIDTDARHPYVLRCDRTLPKDLQTTWLLRVPTAREQRHIDNSTSAWERGGDGEARLVTRDGDSIYWPVKFSLAGFENFGGTEFADEPNRHDPSAPSLVTDAVLSKLRPAWRQELALEVSRLVTITDTDAGNSSLPPTSTTGQDSPSADGAGGDSHGEGDESAVPAKETSGAAS